MKQSAQTIKALIIIFIIAAIIGVATVLMIENVGIAVAKLWGICLSLIVCGITGTIGLVVAEKPAYRTLGGASMLVSGIVFLMATVTILTELEDASFVKFMISLFIISIGLAHICLLHHFNLQNKYAVYARNTATIGIALFTVLLTVRIFDSFGFSYYSLAYGQTAAKFIVVAFIVDLAATILVPLCNRLRVPEQIELNFEEPPVNDQTEKQDPAV